MPRLYYYEPFLRRLKIIDKAKRLTPFRPNWAQIEYLEDVERQLSKNKRVKTIVLKARQLGISTVTEGMFFWNSFLHDFNQALIVSHEVPSSRRLLSMSRTFWDTFPFKRVYTPKYVNQNTLSWVETNSAMEIATAKNETAGRSTTIHNLHGSEVGFWEKPDLMVGLGQAIPEEAPFTFTVLESTANGVGGYFHSEWEAASSGESDFSALFFPWIRHPQYRASAIGLEYEPIRVLSDDEKVLRKLGVDDDQLAWRRYMINNKLNRDVLKFQQEYPTTPEEAFIATGRNVFSLWSLRRVYEPMEGLRGKLVWSGTGPEFVEDRDGPLTIFRRPSRNIEWGQYVIGADPTHTTEGDYAVAQVFSRKTMEQVAVMRYRVTAGHFANDLFALGRFYNWALMAPEKEGPGLMVVGALVSQGYPRMFFHEKVDKTPGKINDPTYGWGTNTQSKHLAIGWMQKVVLEGINEQSGIGFRVHDKHTFREMKNYITLDNGGYGPADEKEGGHDDTVMAAAIAIAAHLLGGPIVPFVDEGVQEMGQMLAEMDPRMFRKFAEHDDLVEERY